MEMKMRLDCVLAFRAFCQILSLCVIISFQNKPNETSVSGENCVLNQSACSDNVLTEILINTKDNSSVHNSDDVVADNENVNDNVFQKTPQPYAVLKTLKYLRVKNHNRIIVGNINSIPNKFDALKTIIPGNIYIFVITETKLDDLL